ncbi:hypothetical protein BC834DRAFT_969174 [Gloeopeniophorella convolvens]|nr:hypothetical protein BC834DRAFT_969174 [Gloeopeniophorella convolvens]
MPRSIAWDYPDVPEGLTPEEYGQLMRAQEAEEAAAERVRPPLLWYGIGFNHEHLAAYAKKRGFWLDSDTSYESKLHVAEVIGGPRLRKEIGWPYLKIRAPYSKQYARIIGMFSSYWAYERILDVRQQTLLLDRIKEEFGIDGEPMWYYDMMECDWEYLKVFPKRYARAYEKQRKRRELEVEQAATAAPAPAESARAPKPNGAASED